MKAPNGKEAAEESLKLAEVHKERSHFHNIKVQGKETSVHIEAATSYSEDPVKISNEGGYIRQHASQVGHW